MIYKKIIGTLVFSLIILGVIMTGFYFVNAQFINTQNVLQLDGIVKIVNSTGSDIYTIKLQTSGTQIIPIDTDNSTNFVGGLIIHDIRPGDHLRIVADIIGNEALAKSVKRIDNVTGYGTAGDPVQINKATVLSKTVNSITVDSGVAIITFQIDSSTGFSGTTLPTLLEGEVVQIHGTDSGSNFLAKLVVMKEKTITTSAGRTR